MRSQILDRRYATVPLTFDRKSIILLGLSKRFCPAKWIPYRGVAQLVARLLWECVDPIHERFGQKPGKPCNTGDSETLSLGQIRRKNRFDHMNDHRQKNL